MNPRDRMIAAFELEEPDLVPIAPILDKEYIPKACGLKVTEWVYSRPTFKARCTARANKPFDFDWVLTSQGNVESWRKWVGANDYPRVILGKGTKDFKETPIADLDIENELDRADLWGEAGSVYLREALREVSDQMAGPYRMPALQAYVWLGQEYFVALHRSPEKMKKLMDIMTCEGEERIDALAETGVDGLYLAEHMASGDCISPQMFAEFVAPLHKRLLDRARNRHLYTVLGFLGYVEDRLEEIANIRPDALLVEGPKGKYEVSLARVKATLEGHVSVMGNVDCMEVLLRGTSAMIAQEVRRCIEGAASGGGYILSTGNILTKDIPLRNVHELVRWGRKLGRYQLIH